MQQWIHFLGKLNKEQVCLIEGDGQPVGAKPHAAALILWHLTQDMEFLKDEQGFEARLASLVQELPADGRLALVWDNPFSVHAFSGGFLDGARLHDGCGVYGLQTALSYTRMQQLLQRVLQGAAAPEWTLRWFYPYPGTAFTTHIFSDDRLPRPGECEDNDYNFDGARLECFEECRAVDTIVQAGLYPQLAHACLAVISHRNAPVLPDFARFSLQRRGGRQIVTTVYRDYVEKTAYDGQAKEHVLAMAEWEEPLNTMLGGVTVLGRRLRVNPVIHVKEQTGCVGFAYAPGSCMEECLDGMLAAGQEQEVCDALLDFCKAMGSLAKEPFVRTPEFTQIFDPDGETGQEDALQGSRCLPVTDIDLVCQNIVLSDTTAEAIDYEWTFSFPIPVGFYIYRFLYMYLDAKGRAPFDRARTDALYEEVGITTVMKKRFERMETCFQQYVQSGAYVLRNAFETSGRPVLRAGQLRRQLQELEGKVLHVLYQGEIWGIHPDETELTLSGGRDEEGIRRFLIPIRSQRMKLSLTGYAGGALMRIGMMKQRAGESVPCVFDADGRHMGGMVYLFEDQPYLRVADLTQQESLLLVSIEEIACSKEAAAEMSTRVEELSFLLDNREQQLEQMKDSASWKLTAPLRKLRGND